MKLLFCPACYDVCKLHYKRTTYCGCELSFGYYEDYINACIGGKAIPIGFTNPSFFRAVNKQPKKGEGESFTAFVIPKKCPTVRKIRRLKEQKNTNTR